MAALLDLMQDPHTTPNIIEMLAPSLAADGSARGQAARAAAEVEGVTSLSDFVPEDQAPKLAAISEARGLLGPSLDPGRPHPASDAEDVQALAGAGAALRKAAGDSPDLAPLARLGVALERLSQGPEPARALARAMLIAPMQALLEDVRLTLQAGPVTIDKLPQELRRDWITADGRARLEIAPRGDKNDNDKMRRFVGSGAESRARRRRRAGLHPRTSGDTVIGAFMQAGALALISITLLLYARLAPGRRRRADPCAAAAGGRLHHGNLRPDRVAAEFRQYHRAAAAARPRRRLQDLLCHRLARGFGQIAAAPG